MRPSPTPDQCPPDDVFDLFNFKHYADPNPYPETAALTVDLA